MRLFTTARELFLQNPGVDGSGNPAPPLFLEVAAGRLPVAEEASNRRARARCALRFKPEREVPALAEAPHALVDARPGLPQVLVRRGRMAVSEGVPHRQEVVMGCFK